MSNEKKIVKAWEIAKGGRAITIPAMYRDVFKDVDFFETSIVNGCLQYRPMVLRGAVE